MVEEKLETKETVVCIICGRQVKDRIFQLCDTDECIESFQDQFVPVLD